MLWANGHDKNVPNSEIGGPAPAPPTPPVIRVERPEKLFRYSVFRYIFFAITKSRWISCYVCIYSSATIAFCTKVFKAMYYIHKYIESVKLYIAPTITINQRRADSLYGKIGTSRKDRSADTDSKFIRVALFSKNSYGPHNSIMPHFISISYNGKSLLFFWAYDLFLGGDSEARREGVNCYTTKFPPS